MCRQQVAHGPGEANDKNYERIRNSYGSWLFGRADYGRTRNTGDANGRLECCRKTRALGCAPNGAGTDALPQRLYSDL